MRCPTFRGLRAATLVVAVALVPSLAAVPATALVTLDGPAPPPPSPPGAITPPASPSSAARQAAVDAYTRTFKINEAEARRRLDLQAKAKDLPAELFSRLGSGLSQVYFDNDSGRYVVVIGRRGNAQRARKALEDLDLTDSAIRSSELNYRELQELVNKVSQRLARAIESGHTTVALVPDGVAITVASDVSAAERADIDEAAKTPGVLVRQSGTNSLAVAPTSCNGSYADGRFCDELVGGDRYFTAAVSCTLAFRSGSYDGVYPNQFLTAGHCVTPGGTTWSSCTAAHTNCFTTVGGEIGQRWDYADNGKLSITSGRIRQAGFIDWRFGSRQPITYYAGWYGMAAGTVVCHAGATTGLSCGTVTSGDVTVQVAAPGHGLGATTLTNMIQTDGICVQPGDSGGPVFTGDMRGAVGINSASSGCGAQSFTEPIRRAIESQGVWPYGG